MVSKATIFAFVVALGVVLPTSQSLGGGGGAASSQKYIQVEGVNASRLLVNALDG